MDFAFCILHKHFTIFSLKILLPIQLTCPIGQVTLIVPFLFLVWVFDFYVLSNFILFSIIPSITHTNFPSSYLKTYNTTLFSTLRVPLLTFFKIREKSNGTPNVNRREYYLFFKIETLYTSSLNPKPSLFSRASFILISNISLTVCATLTPLMAALSYKKSYRPNQSLQQFYTGGPFVVSSDATFLACTCDDSIKIVDFSNASIKFTIEGDSEPITALALSSDDKFLFSSSHSRQIRVWDLATLKCIRSWKVLIATLFFIL